MLVHSSAKGCGPLTLHVKHERRVTLGMLLPVSSVSGAPAPAKRKSYTTSTTNNITTILFCYSERTPRAESSYPVPSAALRNGPTVRWGSCY